MESEDVIKKNILIIDHGQAFIRIGLVKDENPHSIPSLSGAKRKTVGSCLVKLPTAKVVPSDQYYYGDEAIAGGTLFRIEETIENRNALKDNAKGLYAKVLKDIKIEHGLENYEVVFLISAFANSIFLHDVAHIFIEEFKAKEIYFVPQAIANVNYFDTHSGIVIDIGEKVTSIVLVNENKISKNYCEELAIGGADITGYLTGCFEDREYFKFTAIREIYHFKEKNAFVSLDYENELKTNTKKIDFEVEENKHTFSIELFTAAEILFKPSIIKSDTKSLNEAFHDLKHKNNNIFNDNKAILVGGTAKLKNMKERLVENKIEFLNYETSPDDFNWSAARKFVLNNYEKLHEYKTEQKYDKFYFKTLENIITE